MRVRKVDDDGDYVFGHSQADFWVNAPEGVAQEAMTRLRLAQGEWFADLTEGTAWATGVLGERTAATRDAVVRERVLGTPGMQSIDQYGSAMDPSSRTWTAAMVVTTIYGPVALGVQRLAAGLPDGARPPSPVAPARSALLGMRAGGGTTIKATPADMRTAASVSIPDFTVLSIDAGRH